MNNLEDLFTLRSSPLEGEKLNLTYGSKSWLDFFRKKSREPEYRLHLTMAGFPVVLPYKKNGKLFISQNDENIGTILLTRAENEVKLPYGFLLDRNTEYKFEETKLMLGSHIRKDCRSFPKNVPGNVLIGHLVNPYGQIMCVRMEYSLANQGNKRHISFNIYRGKEKGRIFTTLSAKLLTEPFYDINGDLNLHSLDSGVSLNSPIDYEKSLQNLTSILQKEVFTAIDILNLYNLEYLCPSRMRTPDKEGLDKKQLN